MRVSGIRLCLFLLLALSAQFVVPSKIKHVVVLMEENRSFDHMFGYYPGVNGLTGKECNVVNSSVPNSPCIYVDLKEPMIATCDPDHGTPATSYKIFGKEAYMKNDWTKPTMSGFVEWESHRPGKDKNYCDVMSMMAPQHVPVISDLASEFMLMDRFFAAHPGPTWPNRLFMLSGTSAGLTETGPWYRNKLGQLFPQETIFDQLTNEGMTWRNYFNDTPWELMLASIAHNPEHLAPMDQFYADARDGNLPAFSWINPRSGINVTLMQGSNDDHPDHDISLGERFYKDIYEALRSSPQWNETLFVITYDEHGGYYDHVTPPLNVAPPGDGETSYPDEGFLFDRLGIRIPTLLISPWIPKGVVRSSPPSTQKPAKNSEYTLTSIIASTRKLLGMKSPPLTKREAWSATFEDVLSLSSPRTDCPVHLTSALPPSSNYSPEKEASTPVNDLQKQIMAMHAHLAGVDFPDHIQRQGQISEWNQRQFRAHAKRTHEWKKSKSSGEYELVLRPRLYPSYVGYKWNVNQGKTVPFFTISLRNSTLCLDYGSAAPVEGRIVGVANCYPSSNPDTNRDQAQQWMWTYDNTMRPHVNQDLCLTTALLDGKEDDKLYLKTCVKSDVRQHWAWHGPGAGNDDLGAIYFGDYTNTIGVVEA